LLGLLLLPPAAWPATPGSFRGILVEGADTKPGWMYVQSRNDMLRLVNLSRAEVYYAEEIPMGQRRKNAATSLKAGAEVRVLAEEDGHGRWQATEVEILVLAPTRRAHR
jgi:hypothetical protein